jgi:hypothetical protein
MKQDMQLIMHTFTLENLDYKVRLQPQIRMTGTTDKLFQAGRGKR